MVELILKEWKQRIDDIREFTNERSEYHLEEARIPSLFLQLAEFLLSHKNALLEWTMSYLHQHKREIAFRWWTTHITEWALSQIERFPKHELHPRISTDWDTLLGSTPISVIQQTVMNYHRIRDVSYCDVDHIRAIHEGKKCDDSMFCFLCDETEEEWKKELKRRLQDDLTSLLTIKESSDFENWTPPYSYQDDSQHYLDRNEYLVRLTERRITKYTINQTLREKIKTLLYVSFPYYSSRFDPFMYSGWSLPHWKPKDDYELFLLLWNTIDIMRLCIRIDIPQILMIQKEIPNH